MLRLSRIATVLAPLLLLVIFVWTVVASRDSGGARVAAVEPCGLVAAYGGIFETPAGTEVVVTDEKREELLERVRVCVEGLLDEAARARYDELSKAFSGSSATREERSGRSFVQVEMAAVISDAEAMLQQRQVARRLIEGWSSISDIVTRQGAGEVLETSGWRSKTSEPIYRDEASAYHAACRAARVPVPGAFARDRRWIKRADLDDEAHRYFFRSNWTDTEVWTYKAADESYCVALTRRDPKEPKGVSYVGTICVDSSQKNACFFDSMIYEGSGTKRVSWDDFQHRDFTELVHPKDGEDRCNTCHLGANPFIVHPGTVLGTTVQSMYPKSESTPKPTRFEFLGLGGKPEPWINFDAIALVGNNAPRDRCMTCHDIPHVTKDHTFCSGVIQMATKRTMPPGHWPAEPSNGPELWPDDKGCFADGLGKLKDYFASVRRLKSICSGKPEKTCGE